MTRGFSLTLQISPYFVRSPVACRETANKLAHKGPYLYRLLTVHSLPPGSSWIAILALCETQSSKPECVHNLTLVLFGTIYLVTLRHLQSSSPLLPVCSSLLTHSSSAFVCHLLCPSASLPAQSVLPPLTRISFTGRTDGTHVGRQSWANRHGEGSAGLWG